MSQHLARVPPDPDGTSPQRQRACVDVEFPILLQSRVPRTVWAWRWATPPLPLGLGRELLQGPGPASAPPSRGSLSSLGLPGEACAPHSRPGDSTSAPPAVSAGHSHLSGHLGSPSFSPTFLQKMCSGFLSRSASPSDTAQRREGPAPAPLRKPPATPHIGVPSQRHPTPRPGMQPLG